MWAAIVTSMLVALAVFWSTATVERSVLHWKA